MVVQDAAEKISILSGSFSKWFTPCTIFGMPFPGAVNKTLSAPGEFFKRVSASLSLKTPVLSIIRALLMSYFV